MVLQNAFMKIKITKKINYGRKTNNIMPAEA